MCHKLIQIWLLLVHAIFVQGPCSKKQTKQILTFIFILISSYCFSQPVAQNIKLNQIGFYPKALKIAVVTNEINGNNFYIISSSTNDTAYKGLLSNIKQSAYSSTKTRIADFTRLQKEGSYFVWIPGVGNSFKFQIKNNVHHNFAVGALKGFFYMRSGVPLEKKYAGQWNRPAGHPDTAVYVHPSAASEQRPAGAIFSSPRGWYDAGDYNKYIVNSGITMGTLLSLYEDFPVYFNSFKTNIPESNDALPDILNEILFNLRWMLTMQDPYDGGVYHKLTNADFDGMVMPDVTKETRYVVQKSTTATLDFAAVTSQAARVFKKFEKQLPHLTDSCLMAAAKAWDWALKNPSISYNQTELNQKYHPDITTGAYDDRNFNDEWLWAASELFATTKSKNYYTVIDQRLKDSISLQSWGNVAMLGYYTIVRLEKQMPSFAKSIVQTFKDSILHKADVYLSNSFLNAFATIMGQSKRDFIWGSNAVAANQGILLINAY
ncbi:MAG: glycoside hydrolase family 9 protein, partial [Bacteroidota bacterium]|nr:glycoside hydrolase family 9 protein [Bacteroidota bacterium]